MINVLKRNPANTFLMLFVFFLSSWQIVSIIFLVLLIPVLINRYGVHSVLYAIRNEKSLWPFLLFYFLHVAGLIVTENFNYAFLDLQIKLSFLLMPLVLLMLWKEVNFQEVKNIFIAGVIFSLLYCLIFALFRYLQDGNYLVFFYGEYSRFMHSTYYTIYINLAMLFMIERLTVKEASRDRWSNSIWLIGILFMALSVFMLSSRTGTAVMYLTVFSFLALRYLTTGFTFMKSGKVLLLIIVFGLMHSAVLKVYDRYSEVAPEISLEMANNTIQDGAVPVETNSLSSRLFIWPLSWKIILSHPLTGVGTGDLRDVLVSEYEKAGFKEGSEKKLNTHNQFLHTGLILGFPGIFVLLMLFLIPFYLFLKSKIYLPVAFISIYFLNSMTESVLERQVGVILFTFFAGLFLIQTTHKKEDASSHAGESYVDR